MTKKEIRKEYLAKRRAISSHDKLKLDDLLLINFQKMIFETDINCLFTYFPVEKFAEPNMFLFTNYMRFAFPELTVAYPGINAAIPEMQALAINEDTAYKKNFYGLSEPESSDIVSPQDIDMIFVPLLACDQSGYRVGFGKGYYDRFLVSCRDDALKVGFSYFPPIPEINDIDEYDIPIDYCITCNAIYAF